MKAFYQIQKQKTLWEMRRKFSWLKNKSEELEILLFHDCTSNEQRKLIREIFDRFNFLSYSKFLEYINEISFDIASRNNHTAQNTLIVATASDNKPDSSQTIVDALKNRFIKHRWPNVQILNRVEKAWDKSYLNHNNIILVDEFIGTGRTMLKRVDRIKAELLKKSIRPNISIIAIASTQMGLDYLTANGIQVQAKLVVQKGISGCYSNPKTVEFKLLQMKKIESSLMPEISWKEITGVASSTIKPLKLPNLGYGKCEVLYSFEDFNIPNNVFPIFWWPYYDKPSYFDKTLFRKPVFYRDCQDDKYEE